MLERNYKVEVSDGLTERGKAVTQVVVKKDGQPQGDTIFLNRDIDPFSIAKEIYEIGLIYLRNPDFKHFGEVYVEAAALTPGVKRGRGRDKNIPIKIIK